MTENDTDTDDDDPIRWWGKPRRARRFHIFEGESQIAGSLCGNWQFNYDGDDPEVEDDDEVRDGKDCKECARKAGLIE